MRLPTSLATIVIATSSFTASSLAPSSLAPSSPTARTTTSLTAFRDNSRPLLIFAPKANDFQLKIQLHYLQANPSAVTQRDIMAIAIPITGVAPTPITLTSADAQSARQRFGVEPGDFLVILLGKDGGEKIRSNRPVTLQTLTEIIDAMPMRQDEMKRQKP